LTRRGRSAQTRPSTRDRGRGWGGSVMCKRSDAAQADLSRSVVG
jgi:hypothetical protein